MADALKRRGIFEIQQPWADAHQTGPRMTVMIFPDGSRMIKLVKQKII